jgi:hypothetical protein
MTTDIPVNALQYGRLVPCRLLRRYKRFLADVELQQIITTSENAKMTATEGQPSTSITQQQLHTCQNLTEPPLQTEQNDKTASKKRHRPAVVPIDIFSAAKQTTPARSVASAAAADLQMFAFKGSARSESQAAHEGGAAPASGPAKRLAATLKENAMTRSGARLTATPKGMPKLDADKRSGESSKDAPAAAIAVKAVAATETAATGTGAAEAVESALSGPPVTVVHCPNTGPMTGLLDR